MGYTTTFKGVLEFTSELTIPQLKELEQFCGEDCRDHPEWEAGDLTWMDIEITPEYTGIQWDGSEKTYDLVEKINFIINHMRKKWPEFGLKGSMLAQGEDIGDIWNLVIDDSGVAKEVPVDLAAMGKKQVCCPNCEHKFVV